MLKSSHRCAKSAQDARPTSRPAPVAGILEHDVLFLRRIGFLRKAPFAGHSVTGHAETRYGSRLAREITKLRPTCGCTLSMIHAQKAVIYGQSPPGRRRRSPHPGNGVERANRVAILGPL